MGADRPVPGRQESGASVQLVALRAGELKGPGEGADDLGRGVLRTSLSQTQHVVDGEQGAACGPAMPFVVQPSVPGDASAFAQA